MAQDHPTFEDFSTWYRLHRRRSTGRAASEHTLRTKRIYLMRSARETDSREERDLATLLTDPLRTGTLLQSYEDSLTPGAARVAVYALLSFVEYAVAQGWITHASESCVTREDVPSRNPKAPITVYTEDEMDLFVAASRGVGLRWWALMCFLVDSGRRIGETLNIEWDFLKLGGDPAYVEFPQTKNGEPQYVPLTRRLRDDVFTPDNIATLRSEQREGRMAFHRDPAEFVFPWSYRTVHGRFERFCERTGLPNRGFHCFRHTVITERLARGVPIQAVSRLAGHSSVAVTDARYNHADALHFARYIERDELCGS